jgi:hypothetical protein
LLDCDAHQKHDSHNKKLIYIAVYRIDIIYTLGELSYIVVDDSFKLCLDTMGNDGLGSILDAVEMTMEDLICMNKKNRLNNENAYCSSGI